MLVACVFAGWRSIWGWCTGVSLGRFGPLWGVPPRCAAFSCFEGDPRCGAQCKARPCGGSGLGRAAQRASSRYPGWGVQRYSQRVAALVRVVAALVRRVERREMKGKGRKEKERIGKEKERERKEKGKERKGEERRRNGEEKKGRKGKEKGKEREKEEEREKEIARAAHPLTSQRTGTKRCAAPSRQGFL